MKSSFQYPIVSHKDIINLFHAILFWRYEEKVAASIHPRFWFLTFGTVWNLLDMGQILPSSRITRLQGKREFCKLFLKKILVVEHYDDRDWKIILEGGAFRPFCIRKGSRELVRGNSVNFLELCTRTRVFITPFGIRQGPSSVEEVSSLLPREKFSSLWERYTKPYQQDKSTLSVLMKVRNKALNERIWGEKKASDDEIV